MRRLITGTALLFLVFSVIPAFAEDGFTHKDRELLIELKVKMGEMEKRFEQRFIQIDKRFEQMTSFFYILAGIFTSLVVAVIGFGYWDRRTIIREARREAIEFIEKEGMLRRALDALREFSGADSRLADALRRFNLL